MQNVTIVFEFISICPIVDTGRYCNRFNPRPSEVLFVTRPPKGVVATPSMDFPYGTLDAAIFATSV